MGWDVDIIGFLHFWDITIDIISCVNIVLAIGLCVDYSVHIGHAFLIASGKVFNFRSYLHFIFFLLLGGRKAKTEEALLTIGPAVFNGGLTTFLALVLLGFSSSHVFISFFKVNRAKTKCIRRKITILLGLCSDCTVWLVPWSGAFPSDALCRWSNHKRNQPRGDSIN